MELEFHAGQQAWIMLRNLPVETKIRVVSYLESVEQSKNEKTGVVTERINRSCRYGTFADIQTALTADKIGKTKEELISKLFGNNLPETEN